MKKTITLMMALALVTSLFAVPVSPKLQKQGKGKAQTEQKMEQRVPATHQINFAKLQDMVRPVARKAVVKKNIARKAPRKAVQATAFSFLSSIPTGWTVNPTPYGYESTDLARGMQMTATTTITYAGAEDVSSITVTGSTNGAGNTIAVKVGTTDFGSVSLTKGDSHKAYAFSGAKSSGNVVITVTRAVKSVWIESVSLDGTGGGGGGDTITLNTMKYVDALYSEGYWDFDMYVDYDETTGLTYPEFYFMCDEDATSQTAISGEWTMYYGGVWNSEKDSVEMEEGSLSVTVNLDKTYNFYGTFTGNDGKVYKVDIKNVEVGAYDVDNDYEEIELDEEGGGSTVDTVVVKVNNVLATRYDSYSETGAYLWQIDALNYTSNTQYEDVWFNITTPQNNRLEGIYDIESDNIYNYYGYYYYAGYTKVNGNDTTEVSAGSENIQLMVAYDETSKAYDMYGELLSDDGKKLYMFEVEDMYISASDEEMVDITLVDSTEFVPDTIDITGMDAIEFAYYASYSEEGSYYNYSANLYNSQDEDYVPYVALDIYTFTKDAFVGSYDTTTNVGEYSSYYPDADSYGESVINPVFTISKNGDVYTVAGSFTGADQNIYRFSVSAEASMADGDYPYEPMEKQADVNVVANSKKLVTDYVSEYSELDLYLNGENDTIQLALTTSKTTIADGTYAISTAEEPADGELIAGYYGYYGLGGCVAYVGDEVYYLTSGSLVVATANDTVTYSLNATSAHGTVVNAVYKEYKAGPTPGEGISFTFTAITDTLQTKSGVTVRLNKGTGQTVPAYYESGLRLYANNAITVTGSSMVSIEVICSKQGTKDYATMSADKETFVSGGESTSSDDKVSDIWTGEANSVVFSLGASGQRIIHEIIVKVAGGGGGDTIKIEDVDGLEIDYYPSYSSQGAYDYTFLLYNSEDENYIPMVAFDILTATEKSYTGTYTMQGGTLTEYSYYVYGTGDEDYLEFTDGEITITDNGNSNYTIKGWFTDGTKVYTVDVTLDGEYLNADYPYEPETKTTLNLTITDGEIDDSYATSYGMIDIYLTTADGEVQLEYYLPASATTLEDGTYPIEAADYDEEGTIQQTYGFFDAGYYYSGYSMAVASYYQTDEEIYYLVGGTVKVETVAEGTKITLAGTTYYGSTINAVYTITSTALQTIEAGKVAEGKYMKGDKLFIQRNGVLYNAQGQVVR